MGAYMFNVSKGWCKLVGYQHFTEAIPLLLPSPYSDGQLSLSVQKQITHLRIQKSVRRQAHESGK